MTVTAPQPKPKPKMPNVRKYKRNTSITSTSTTEVSSCLKYMIFGFNVVFWLLGLGILTIGVWAWSEKDIFNNLGKAGNIALDPAFILICVGTVTFIIGFTGCVGALRENTCLLATYAMILTSLLLFEMFAGVLGFIFKDWLKSQATIGFQTFIIHYREDPDQQNLIDWIQEDWLQCCGIEGPKDWDKNNYFNCSSREIGSSEACGVPFSCCKTKPNEIIKNKQCGYGVRMPGFQEPNSSSFDLSKDIFERGCLEALEEWTEKHMISIASYCFLILFFQGATSYVMLGRGVQKISSLVRKENPGKLDLREACAKLLGGCLDVVSKRHHYKGTQQVGCGQKT